MFGLRSKSHMIAGVIQLRERIVVITAISQILRIDGKYYSGIFGRFVEWHLKLFLCVIPSMVIGKGLCQVIFLNLTSYLSAVDVERKQQHLYFGLLRDKFTIAGAASGFY